MYCSNCGAKLADDAKYCGSCGTQTEGTKPSIPIEYFAISPRRLMLFSVLTFNLYEIYWFYRNWEAVKKAEGADIQPIWRAIFTIFFCYELFKNILREAKANGYSRSYSAGWLATAYIILLFAGNAYSRLSVSDIGDSFSYLFWLIVLLILTPLALLPIQGAINFNLAKIKPGTEPSATFTGGEVTLIIIGVILMALAILGSLAS